jgi:hypothetical protein
VHIATPTPFQGDARAVLLKPRSVDRWLLAGIRGEPKALFERRVRKESKFASIQDTRRAIAATLNQDFRRKRVAFDIHHAKYGGGEGRSDWVRAT